MPARVGCPRIGHTAHHRAQSGPINRDKRGPGCPNRKSFVVARREGHRTTVALRETRARSEINVTPSLLAWSTRSVNTAARPPHPSPPPNEGENVPEPLSGPAPSSCSTCASPPLSPGPASGVASSGAVPSVVSGTASPAPPSATASSAGSILSRPDLANRGNRKVSVVVSFSKCLFLIFSLYCTSCCPFGT